jgi:plastocyanin
MRMRKRYLPLVALLGASVAVLPAIASSAGPSSTATVSGLESLMWSPMEVTVTPGGTVTFEDASTSVPHGIVWTHVPATPSCTGVPIDEGKTDWQGTCTFAQEGVYEYDCYVHGAYMSGKVYVSQAGTMPTSSSTAPGSSSTSTMTMSAPGASTVPGATQTGATKPPTPADSLSASTLRLASSQRGPRVQGSVQVAQSGSRLTVEVFTAAAQLADVARLGHPAQRARARRSPARIGRFARSSLPAGRAFFSVTLDQRAARALRKNRHLAVSVRLMLTTPAGTVVTRAVPVILHAS